MTHRASSLFCRALLVAAAFAFSAVQAQDFPTRPVRFIAPYAQGQGADIIARIVAERLTEKWGQPVVVENRAGGAGVPGTIAARTATPDGYTILVGGSQTMTILPSVYTKPPYDPAKDFSAVTGLYATPLVLVASKDSGIASIAALKAAAQKEPGKLMHGSANGSSQHLAAELLRFRSGIEITHVPYRGSGPAMIDLLGGQIPLMVDGLSSAMPHIKSDKVIAVAVTTPERVPQLPDVPTIAEQGVPGYSAIGWAGLFVPTGTPQEIVEKISKDVRDVLSQPAVREKLAARGTIPDPSTPRETAEFVRTDTAKWAEVARAAGIKLD